MHEIGFPHLGLGPFAIDPTALSFGPFHIQWYGLIIVCGMILGSLYVYRCMKALGMTLDDTLNVCLAAIPAAIVGARAYYVLTTLHVYRYDSFLDVIAVWNGGLAIYGGILGGLVAVYILCRVKKYPFVGVLDCIVGGLFIGQAIGRWGNFANAEAYGVIDRYDFLTHTFSFSEEAMKRNPLIMTIDGLYVQPTYLYESVWNLVGFLLLHFLVRKKKRGEGEMLCFYVAWYGFGRCVIEGMRGDSLYIGAFRISQLLAFVCFIAGTAVYVTLRVKRRQKEK